MHKLYNEIENIMSRIEKNWQKNDYSTDHFSSIVWEETASLDLSPLGNISNQLKLMDVPGIRIQQQRSTFSDLYMQIFHNGRFMIEILNWWGGHVNVHDHDFAAVQFQVKGDALNVVYDFDQKESAGALRFGELSVREAELWKEGGRSIVNPGDVDPHGVFHIGSPTTSLLIRTVQTPRYGAQSNYFPDLAGHYYVSNDIQRKKLTALSLLSSQYPAEFREHLNSFLSTQSSSENFFMLLKLAPILLQEKYTNILENFSSKGLKEEKIINSVIVNSGIDFFKTKANEKSDLTDVEKLAAFVVASSHSLPNFEKVLAGLSEHYSKNDILVSLNSFLNKLSEEERASANGYLKIFGLQEIL